jgi:hypothetical protein
MLLRAMATNQLLHGLKRQYAKTLGEIEAGGDVAMTEDIAHLAAVIRMFAPFEDLTAILPIRPYRPNRSRWSRAALDILRQANGPMTVRELAERVLAARGAVATWEALQGVEASLSAVMTRLERRGMLHGVGHPKEWFLKH